MIPVFLRTRKTEEEQLAFQALSPFQDEMFAKSFGQGRVCGH